MSVNSVISKVLRIVEATPEVKAQRRAICEACPEINRAAYRGQGACGACGCFLPGLITWAGSKCKRGKWASESPNA